MLGLGGGVVGEGEVDAAHGLELAGRNIAGHDGGFADGHAGVKDGLLPAGSDVPVGILVVDHHGDLSAEVLFVEAEGLLAVSAVVEIGNEFHRSRFLS